MKKVSMLELEKINPSEELKTATYQPLPHFTAVNQAVKTFNDRTGFEVIDAQIQLSDDDQRLIGYFNTNAPQIGGIKPMFAVMNSYNKMIAYQIVIAGMVSCCMNGCVFTQNEIGRAKRMHTSEINLEYAWQYVFDEWDKYMLGIKNVEARLRGNFLTENIASRKIIECVEKNAIASSDVLPVWNEYCKPHHKEHGRETEWCLYNAVTEVSKKFPALKQNRCYMNLTKIFNMELAS